MGIGRIDPDLIAASPTRVPVRHFHTATGEVCAGTRRQFLRGAGVAAGALVATAAFRPSFAFAAGNASPRPIAGGFRGDAVGDAGNRHFYHILPPFPPGPDGQYIDCSAITDFRGVIGAANINGTGTGTPTAANAEGRYTFNVDMRFMQGDYIAVDGKRRYGTFGFI